MPLASNATTKIGAFGMVEMVEAFTIITPLPQVSVVCGVILEFSLTDCAYRKPTAIHNVLEEMVEAASPTAFAQTHLDTTVCA